jgi:hypothetical protein
MLRVVPATKVALVGGRETQRGLRVALVQGQFTTGIVSSDVAVNPIIPLKPNIDNSRYDARWTQADPECSPKNRLKPRPSRLQSRAILAGTPEDDAMVGGLSGWRGEEEVTFCK